MKPALIRSSIPIIGTDWDRRYNSANKSPSSCAILNGGPQRWGSGTLLWYHNTGQHIALHHIECEVTHWTNTKANHFLGVRVVIIFGRRAVYFEGIDFSRPPNSNFDHESRFAVGIIIIIYIEVEKHDKEDGYLSTGVRCNSIHESESRSQLATDWVRNHIHHTSHVGNRKIPVVTRYISFSELRMGYVAHHLLLTHSTKPSENCWPASTSIILDLLRYIYRQMPPPPVS